MTVRLSAPRARRGRAGVDRGLLRLRARRLLRALDRAGAELSIALVSDAEIAALNRRYRGLPGATDVLSFSLVEGEHSAHRGCLLGDVVIGLETAARQARAARRSLDDEVARLLVHGALHLLGHDHEEAAAARAMRAEERRVWRAIRA
jgi:probable rRNA maturation factor